MTRLTRCCRTPPELQLRRLELPSVPSMRELCVGRADNLSGEIDVGLETSVANLLNSACPPKPTA